MLMSKLTELGRNQLNINWEQNKTGETKIWISTKNAHKQFEYTRIYVWAKDMSYNVAKFII